MHMNDISIPEYARILGDSIKTAREAASLTQAELAEKTGIDSRTILNIENYHGNPKMQVLYPLIRALEIDANEIFYSREYQGSTKLHKLELLLADCSEEEIEALIPVCKSVITAIRSKEPVTIINYM